MYWPPESTCAQQHGPLHEAVHGARARAGASPADSGPGGHPEAQVGRAWEEGKMAAARARREVFVQEWRSGAPIEVGHKRDTAAMVNAASNTTRRRGPPSTRAARENTAMASPYC